MGNTQTIQPNKNKISKWFIYLKNVLCIDL